MRAREGAVRALQVGGGMAGLPEQEITSVVDGVETTLEETEEWRCVHCGNRTGRADAMWFGSHGVWCLRCFSNHLVDPLP
jgi:hypothetical protein